MDISIDNSEVKINLDNFLNKGFSQYLLDGLDKAGYVVENAAKRKAPVGTGELRNSITHVLDSDAIACEIGTNLEYAPYVEIGTGIYSSKGTGRKTPWVYQDARGDWHRTVGMKPQPFLEPAAKDNSNKILECFEDLI